MDQPDSILKMEVILLKIQNKFISVYYKIQVWPCFNLFLEFDSLPTLCSLTYNLDIFW